MPKGVVKTKKDEARWDEAKRIVHRQYPGLSEDNDRFWKIVQSIYQNMGKSMKNIDQEIMSKAVTVSLAYPGLVKNFKQFCKDNYFLLCTHYQNMKRGYTLRSGLLKAGTKRRYFFKSQDVEWAIVKGEHVLTQRLEDGSRIAVGEIKDLKGE